jgi:hypothetical protein
VNFSQTLVFSFRGREYHISSVMTSLSTTNTLHQFPSIQSTHQNAFPTFLNDTKSVEHLNPFADFNCKECGGTQMIEGFSHY